MGDQKHKARFTKQERLCSVKDLDRLYKNGNQVKVFPLKLLYQEVSKSDKQWPVPIKIAISVPKRLYKKAVDRNTLKRRLKEAYRTKKQSLYDLCGSEIKLSVLLIYIGREMVDSAEINKKMQSVLEALSKKINEKK